MIRKLKSGEFRLYSRKKNPATGKRRNLGTFRTREAAGDRTPRGSAARQTLKKGPAREGRTGAGPSLRSGTPARQEHGDNPGMPGWLLSCPMLVISVRSRTAPAQIADLPLPLKKLAFRPTAWPADPLSAGADRSSSAAPGSPPRR